MSRFALFLLATLALACRSKPYTYQSQEVDVAEKSRSPQLVFLAFRITSDSAGHRHTALISKTVAEGTALDVPYPAAGNFLSVSLLDKNKKSLAVVRHQHPLLREVEFVNEQKAFERKLVVLNDVEFFVRMVFPLGTSYIRVEETMNGKQKIISEIPY